MYEYIASEYKYEYGYLKCVLEYFSCTSTSTKYHNSGQDRLQSNIDSKFPIGYSNLLFIHITIAPQPKLVRASSFLSGLERIRDNKQSFYVR